VEYLARDWVKALSLGNSGVWCTLYAAIRAEDQDIAFLQDFLATARTSCLNTLKGIR
jgi:LysR family transcriptional regulator for metE and metH